MCDVRKIIPVSCFFILQKEEENFILFDRIVRKADSMDWSGDTYYLKVYTETCEKYLVFTLSVRGMLENLQKLESSLEI